MVEEEVRVNVLNRPYGLFYAIDLPGKAFDTYPNAHNFYGEFKDLDGARIEDVEKFYRQYYVPNNAVLAIVGDVNAADVFAKVEKYFGPVPAGAAPPQVKADEAAQTSERRSVQTDKLANLPALAVGYRMPPRGSHDAVVAAVAGELLHNGQASRLYQSLVKEKKKAVSVDGGVNFPLGNPFEYNGPTLLVSFVVAPANSEEDALITAYDDAIADLARRGPDAAELDRIRAKMRSDWYAELEIPIRRASSLSHAVLFDGNADRVSSIPDEINGVSSDDIRKFAAKYLVKTNRTIIWRVPAPKEGDRK